VADTIVVWDRFLLCCDVDDLTFIRVESHLSFSQD